MARILFIGSILSIFIFSCSTEKEQTTVLRGDSVDVEQRIALNVSDSTELTDTLQNRGRITMSEIMDAFVYCRETAENSLQCKYFIAKAIDDYFGIDDFKVNGTFVDFEQIPFLVKSNSSWKNIGLATNQAALEMAQNHANDGKPVLAMQTNTKYGHIVIILPGKLEKAMNWGGLAVPKCASFFLVENMEPYIDKSMAYSWGSPEGIELFVRE